MTSNLRRAALLVIPLAILLLGGGVASGESGGVAAATAATAASTDIDPGSCLATLTKANSKFRTVAPGVYVQEFDKTDVTGGIAGIPDRVVTDLAPGQSGTVCVGFHNRTGDTVRLRFQTHDFGASRAGAPIPVASGDQVYGAGSWLHLPTKVSVPLIHGELVWLDIKADVPTDTAGGSAYAGVSGSPVEDVIDEETESGNRARISPAVVVQVFFDVPGDTTTGGKIENVRSPRVVWWDGFRVARIKALENLRGQGIAPIRFDWVNTGSLTDEISGSVRFESSLGGRDVGKLPIDEKVVLRDSKREFDVTWSKDIPFIGRFTPTIEVTDASGKVHSEQLDPIWVIPSWWYFIALALAIGIPLWIRHRNKRRYAELLARVEAAEARDDDADEWDDDPYATS